MVLAIVYKIYDDEETYIGSTTISLSTSGGGCSSDSDCDYLDNPPCIDYICQDDSCTVTYPNVPCDDNLFCTGTETCQSGDCVSSGNPCNAGEICKEDTNSCEEGSDIVLELNFEEGSGSTVNDNSGNNNHGTITGATYTTNSKFGNYALSFDGLNDYVTIHDDSTLDITDELTLEAWIYPTAITDYDSIITKASDTSSPPWTYYALGFDADTEMIRCRIFTGTSYKVMSSVLSPNNWYHVVGTYSSSTNELSIYLNGVLQNSITASGQIATNNKDVLIGGFEYGTDESFNGYIDDVRIYNKALSSQEVKDRYGQSGECHEADLDCNNDISMQELLDFIEEWKKGNAEMQDLIEAIISWKS